MPPLQLKINRCYRTRGGKVVLIVGKNGIKEFLYIGDNNRIYDPDGQATLKDEGVEHEDDLLSEIAIGQDREYKIPWNVSEMAFTVEKRVAPLNIVLISGDVAMTIRLENGQPQPIISYSKLAN